MNCINFPQSNTVLNPPEGETPVLVAPIHVYRDDSWVISCWELSEEEMEKIQKTRKVWLWIIGRTMPPAAISGSNPFELEPPV